MAFIELNRYFVPVSKDREPILNVGLWNHFSNGLHWPDVLEHRRVILLAEASSGKTEEFRNQRERLVLAGEPAFYLRIEELADRGFAPALESRDAEMFAMWREGHDDAYFFLDSVDEARLNRKNFETALKRFVGDLARSAERARVFISCRVSDWKWQDDRALVERLLPAWETPQEKTADQNPLLDPIFNKQPSTQIRNDKKPQQHAEDLLVVQLVPLSSEQCRMLAKGLGIQDADAFMAAIDQSGLGVFAERPGDVIDLVDYWKTYNQFGKLAEMVEHSITLKLKERDRYRSDNDTLPLAKARHGAERVAAALTLGKSFTLRAPGHDSADPEQVSGALDPSQILEDWNPAEQNALLRRGIFAPSTYGRIRFHHRSTQEYLTAQWLHRTLGANCPLAEVWNSIFAERYGIETVVPSLSPAAAWLALRHPDICNEIIRREPLTLIRFGDPASLSLDAKKRLLLSYAAKDARGEIADDSLDRRALWLFADPGLADTIQEVWGKNARRDFRLKLLRIIREGAITECLDFARITVSDSSADDYNRIVALEALAACKDHITLKAAAQQLVANRDQVSARLASSFAQILYPAQLSVDEVLDVIAANKASTARALGSFVHVITEIYDAGPDAIARAQFAAGLAELCLTPPFDRRLSGISERYVDLAQRLEPIAKREVEALGTIKSADHVVRLLMVVERVGRHGSGNAQALLSESVRANAALRQALFWADIEEHRKHIGDQARPLISPYQLSVYDDAFWGIGVADLPWLLDDLSSRSGIDDRRILLAAIVPSLQRQGGLQEQLPKLRKLVGSDPILRQDLENLTRPPSNDVHTRRLQQRFKKQEREQEEAQDRAKASWVTFREYLSANLNQLRDPRLLAHWKTGAFRLYNLTEWLEHPTGRQDANAAQRWRLLEEGFGREIAEAYRDGMKALWRVTKPEAPKHAPGAAMTTKRVTILAYAGVSIEAAESPDWAEHLSSQEAKRAALHGCLSEQGYPEWIDDLIGLHPDTTLPVVKRAIKAELTAVGLGRSDFLYRLARADSTIPPRLKPMLFNLLMAMEPGELNRLDYTVGILSRLDLNGDQRRKLRRIARTRLRALQEKGHADRALRYLALLLVSDPDKTDRDLVRWFTYPTEEMRRLNAEQTLEFLFDRHHPVIPDLHAKMSICGLETLLRLAYRYIRPEDDRAHEGAYTPDRRDHAESARNVVLSAIIDRPGLKAYQALKQMALDPEYAIRRERFQELAHGKAERDCESPPWSAVEVVDFERTHTAPIKTGDDLLRVVMAVLQDIQFQLDKGDVTSRPLLQRANTEDEARNWIVEQMKLRAKGRFHAYREAQVANKDRQDIIVASATAPYEVGMEVKHGGKGWTYAQLEHALRIQLAKDYLKPVSRRHGVFVVTNHTQRRWRIQGIRDAAGFDALMKRLTSIAKGIKENDSGQIEVRCFGVDAAPAI